MAKLFPSPPPAVDHAGAIRSARSGGGLLTALAEAALKRQGDALCFLRRRHDRDAETFRTLMSARSPLTAAGTVAIYWQAALSDGMAAGMRLGATWRPARNALAPAPATEPGAPNPGAPAAAFLTTPQSAKRLHTVPARPAPREGMAGPGEENRVFGPLDTDQGNHPSPGASLPS